MQLPDTPNLSSSITLGSRFPGEILYLIGCFSSFEVLSNLVRCNKWLHSSCYPLLFREIHLRSPAQVYKLCNNKEAMGMLTLTKSLLLGDRIFGGPQESTSNSLPPPGARSSKICDLLNAMESLVRLHISGSKAGPDNPGTRVAIRWRYQRFNMTISRFGSSPTFLPNLAIIDESLTGILLDNLCFNRPIVYLCRLSRHLIYLDICPGLSEPTATGTRAVEVTHGFSAHDVGSIICDSKLASAPFPSAFTLNLIMRFPDEIRQQKPCPINDQWQWIQTMLAAADLSANELQSIDIRFEPSPPHQPLAVQLRAIEQLHRSFPSLRDATILSPRIRWRHNNTLSLHGDLAAWVVYPDAEIPETIDWWYNMLNLAKLGAINVERVEQTIKNLSDWMRLGRGEDLPSVEELIGYLR